MNDWARALSAWSIPAARLELARRGLEATAEVRASVRERGQINQWKVLEAFQAHPLSEQQLGGTSGYGYSDGSREALDGVLARLFRAEAGMVRMQLVSGTHAIATCLFGNLSPGDTLVSLTGPPYDTLRPVIGPGPGSLLEMGVAYLEHPLTSEGRIDFAGLHRALEPAPRVVFMQRSRGYTWRPSLRLAELQQAIHEVRRLAPACVILVDNCYGELVETVEPIELGADLVAGSMIKNLGGAVAPTGGYIAGTAEAVRRASWRVTAPGIGTEMGPTLGFSRLLAQGLFMAPNVIAAALEGAVWAAWVLEECGYEVSPRWDEPRTDIIQAVRLGSPEAQRAFCRGVQRAGAVDFRAVPTPNMNPGYRDPILMAGGTFVAGSSIELSADGPLREPYACYLQGGVSLAHVQLGVLLALHELS